MAHSNVPSISYALLLSLAGAVLIHILYKTVRAVIGHFTSSLRTIRGPPSSHWLYGNLREISGLEGSARLDQWMGQYGKVLHVRTTFNASRLCTFDTKALGHVLTNTMTWRRAERSNFGLAKLLGEGILVVEGDKHRQQRKILGPAFGSPQIRELTPTFFETALELCDLWRKEFVRDEDSSAVIDVVSWIGRATLDIIGLGGFNYKFNALSSPGQDELQEAFERAFHFSARIPLSTYAQAYFPLLRHSLLRSRTQKVIDAGQLKMREIATRIVEEKKAAIINSRQGPLDKNDESVKAKDLLTRLVRANMAEDLPENQRMSNEEIVSQIPTFLMAGHETTSAVITYCLFALAQNPTIQNTLREELLGLPTDVPEMEELNALPFLDAVVREALRLYVPITMTNRVATEDDVLPLNEPFTDSQGRVHDQITVKKGTTILLPILSFNRSKDIWGEDAIEFRPERWNQPPESSTNIPGVWGHLLTFLSGPHACLGYRFAVIELKALVYTLVRAFEFEPAVPASDVQSLSSLQYRPYTKFR